MFSKRETPALFKESLRARAATSCSVVAARALSSPLVSARSASATSPSAQSALPAADRARSASRARRLRRCEGSGGGAAPLALCDDESASVSRSSVREDSLTCTVSVDCSSSALARSSRHACAASKSAEPSARLLSKDGLAFFFSCPNLWRTYREREREREDSKPLRACADSLMIGSGLDTRATLGCSRRERLQQRLRGALRGNGKRKARDRPHERGGRGGDLFNTTQSLYERFQKPRGVSFQHTRECGDRFRVEGFDPLSLES